MMQVPGLCAGSEFCAPRAGPWPLLPVFAMALQAFLHGSLGEASHLAGHQPTSRAWHPSGGISLGWGAEEAACPQCGMR